MAAVVVPQIVLNSGRRMPSIGLGTASFPQSPEQTVTEAVLDAIVAGYRHFDTASVYGSERAVGRAISAALERGLVAGGREELFVTTKLWCTDMLPDRVVPALRESLRNLGLDYVDLFLIHYPVRLNGEKDMLFKADAVNPDVDMEGVWKGMEECQKLGLAMSIGVSNFSCKKLDACNHSSCCESGGDASNMAAKEIARTLLKEKYSCECLLSVGCNWGILGYQRSASFRSSHKSCSIHEQKQRPGLFKMGN